MSDFFRDTLHIAADGQLHVNEFILAAIVVVAAILLIAVARDVARSVKNKMPDERVQYSATGKTDIKTG